MPTLAAYRRALAEKLTAFETWKTGVQSSPPSGSYVGVASGTGVDVTRWIVSSDLASSGRDGGAGTTSQSKYDGVYWYLPSTQVQRKVVERGYEPSVAASTVTDQAVTTKVGYLILDRAAASAAIAAGLSFELLLRLPAFDQDGLPGLHTLINRALRLLRLKDRLSIVAGTNQRRYDLSASTYAFITRESQLGNVYDAEYDSNADPEILPGTHFLRFDNDTPYLILETAPAAGSTFYVDVFRPASTWIKVASTWATSTVGLVNESDEAEAELDAVTLLAYSHACKALAMKSPQGDEAYWEKEALTAAIAAAPFIEHQQPTMEAPRQGQSWTTMDSPAFLRRRENGRRPGGRRWP